MGNNNIIKQSNPGIVLEETPLSLTDEKLNGMLLRTYEKAVRDVTKWKYYKLYSILLSIAGTLFLSLLTSEYNDLGALDSSTIRIIVIVTTTIAAIMGFIFLGISVSHKKKSDTEGRDASIKEITDKYFKQGL